jgi:hypothetical protein
MAHGDILIAENKSTFIVGVKGIIAGNEGFVLAGTN